LVSLDNLTRQDIHEHLSYRFVEAASGHQTLKLEAEVRKGALAQGMPRLNPANACWDAISGPRLGRGASAWPV